MGYLFFGFLREITRKLEPVEAASILEVLTLVEAGYFLLGAAFLLYCFTVLKPPREEDFTKTKWWMAWATLHLPTRGASASGDSDASKKRDAMVLNTASGLLMVEGTNLDTGGNFFGSGFDSGADAFDSMNSGPDFSGTGMP